MCLFCFMYMLVCMLVCWVCEGAGSFAGGWSSLAVSYCFLFLFVLEKYWINIVLYCFLCWNRLLFCLGIILEKYYWFNIVLFFLLEYYWKSMGFILFSISFCIGKVLD